MKFFYSMVFFGIELFMLPPTPPHAAAASTTTQPFNIKQNFPFFFSFPQLHHCNVGACSSEKKLQASSALKKLCSSIFTTYCV